jgi:WD40 repeat protein
MPHRILPETPLPDEDWGDPSFSDDGRFAGACSQKEIRVWDLQDRDSEGHYSTKKYQRYPLGDGTRSQILRLSSLGSPSFVQRHTRLHSPPLLTGQLGRFLAENVATLSTGVEILAANGEGKSYLWNAARPGTLMTFMPPMGAIRWAELSPDDRLLLVATDKAFWIVDVHRGKVLIHETAESPCPSRLIASPNRRWIVAVLDGGLRIWRWPG